MNNTKTILVQPNKMDFLKPGSKIKGTTRSQSTQLAKLHKFDLSLKS